MKRSTLLTIFYFLFFSTICFAQIPKNEFYSDGSIKVEWFSEFGENDLIRKEYYPNGSLLNEAQYENGKIHGIYREYDRNENVLVEFNYSNGFEHGSYKEFSEGGIVLKEGSYTNGELDGMQTLYDENGSLFQKMEYIDGIQQGITKVFYPGGIIKDEYHYVKGELSGPAKFYDSLGRLKGESNYKNDLRQGIAKEYYENGNMRVKMNFVDDFIEGEFVEYYENQMIKTHDIISKGAIIERKTYDKNGKFVKNLSFTQESLKKEKDNLKHIQQQSYLKLEGDTEGLSGVIKGKFKVAMFIFLVIAFLMIGVFVGNTLHVSKLQDVEIKTPEIIAPKTENLEHISIKREFNMLHQESDKMYRSLVETVKSGIFMADIKGNLFYVNNMFSQIFGYKTKQEVIGLNLNDEFKSIDDPENSLLKVMGEANEIHDFQFKFRLKDNFVIVLSASANRIFDDSGEVIGLQGVVTDITEKNQLEEYVHNEKRKLEAILAFFEDIDKINEHKKLLEFGVKGIANILEASKCFIMLKDEKTNIFTVEGARGLEEETVKQLKVDEADSIVGDVIRGGKPLFVENIEYDKKLSTITRPTFLGRSFMVAPVEYEGKVSGLIIVTKKVNKFQSEIPFNRTDFKILNIISGKVSTVMENIKLYDELNVQTVIDPITKIYNYRRLSDSLDREILRFNREARQFYIYMMDIDDFKSYNDTYGHLEGDELLTNLGKILNDQVRKTDIVCRYAGDEFCIVLSNTNLEGAITPAEKIVKAVEQFKFKRTVTISIGIAGYEKGMTKKDLIGKADKALYQAKQQGKNQIVISKAND